MVSDTPTAGDRVAVEEHGRRLEEQRSRLVKAKRFPEPGVNSLRCSDTASREVTDRSEYQVL